MATLIRSDLEFILQQILIAEEHVAGGGTLEALTSQLPNDLAMLGLRTVSGEFNNVVPGQQFFGAADQPFPSLQDPFFRPAEDNPFIPGQQLTSYDGPPFTTVYDSQPRTISNLIVDQTITNPAAVQAFVGGGFGIMVDDVLHYVNADGSTGDEVLAGVTLVIPNTAPDEGLSAGFNTWFTFFGQFFDHGLDFIQRTDELVVVPLNADDPIFDQFPDAPPIMVIQRTVKDADGAALNHTSPFVDQNQTYSSHPSHQVFLREYELNADGDPVATGRLIRGENGGMATWADVKEQARTMLGIELTDADVGRVPLVYTDSYGNFIRGANGLPQLITDMSVPPTLVPADLGTPVSASLALATGHAFIIDIAHAAAPVFVDLDNDPDTPAVLAPDSDSVVGLSEPGTYDNELLDAHFMAGDGRVNENIGLTAVHHVFHSEHNRQIEEIITTIEASGDPLFIASWQISPGVWDGERLFQAAKFATEMQYQHLVFEEFARKVQPNIDEFLMYDSTINPAIFAEFAHTVFRFGHSMLTETIDRFDPNFASSEIGLVEAFLNPLQFDADGALTADAAAGAIVRGTTRQLGNEIDEFVTETLRNNLLGLPLDLATINLARGREAGIPTFNAARAEFYRGTGDTQLKPYVSWVDFADNLRHPESIINFIAAYGTHDTIVDETTLAGKRAAATLLVFGGAGEPVDRIDFLNSTDTWANGAAGRTTDFDGVTNTGLGNVDLWIGGLAERQMPFGGLLGSTFNFVFETQLEALQNGDRFYYLGRLAGLNFLTEMENNSFAKLIMANTNATHLPADVFSTPTWILEVNPAQQFNDTDGDGLLDSADPVGDSVLTPLVIRDNPATDGPDTNYLRYTGVDHVVLGGTPGDDIIIGSIGDDTLWGDAGNDRLEGGDGVDNISGGDGHDIITDLGADDNIKGDAGNDVIHGGNGFNLIIGGDGKDFIVTGEDVSDTFGGQGDDFILGAKTNLPSMGNEGNDWIEIGTQDGVPGDNFNLLNLDTVPGHDVLIGGGGFDEMLAEGGHDVMVGSEGEDHFDGGSGFDWATYKNDTRGVTVDLAVTDFVEPPTTPSNAGILDRFAFTEGLAGSAFADILRGDDQEFADILAAGARGSVLDQEGIDLISGLQAVVGSGVTSFAGGNIILGGGGSDIIEGRAGNDIIDGDAWLNVRISVRAGIDADGLATGVEIRSVDSMQDLVQDMLAGTYNPGQLVAVREILAGSDDFDTAVFSAPLANYTFSTAFDGTTVVTDNRVIGVGVPVTDGIDTLRGVERLQFADQAVVLPGGVGLNNAPVGQLTISDDTPSVNQLITVSNLGVTDADGITAGSYDYLWQVERFAGTGVFTDIVLDIGGSPSLAHSTSFRVTADLDGLALRVRATYQDGDGTLENVYSAATAAVAGVEALPPVVTPPAETVVASAGNGVHFIRSDLEFILQQIMIGEANSNAYGGTATPLTELLANSRNAFGLRTVDGSFNNLLPGQEGFGASDQNFPLQLDQVFRNEGDDTIDLPGPAPVITNNNYASTISVADADPRIISNLIVDQTITNPVAVQAYVDAGFGILVDGVLHYLEDDGVTAGDVVPPGTTLTLPNVTPDEGLSAGFNTWFTFFGQFFDHGLDLVDKGGNGTVYMPLQTDDPLYDLGLDGVVSADDGFGADGILGTADDRPNFMVLTRATNSSVTPGADGILGTADDVHTHNNETTPFVDQNQTYTSHASHQVFLREYAFNGLGDPVSTGRLIDSASDGIGSWAEIKAQAAMYLGIQLTDFDVHDVPLLATDLYGKFIPGPNGFAQFETTTGRVEANPAANGGAGTLVPVNGLRTGHAFLNDIAHHAAPGSFDPDGPGGPTPPVPQTPDLDGPEGLFGDDFNPTTYDNELLDAHLITGDGRGNENIGLTSVHFIFHAEHNRLAEHIKDVAVASNDLSFLNQWLLTPATTLPTTPAGIDALNWNGERIFQAARFGTEMQYQHLVFEEFARKIQPQVDIFFAPTQVYDTAINPAIVAEFAHTVYRFGHSLLPDTVDRFDASFALVGTDPSQQIGLIEAFLNPLEFTASGVDDVDAAGNIIRGVTRQIGNEIDEFVTEAVRNNLLGLPLDLPAINLARGRDTGVPPLNQARAEFYQMTGDSQLKPYISWIDLAASLKHEASLVNFVAAYGKHESITDADTTFAKREAAYALVYGEGGMDGDVLTLGDNPTVGTVPADRMEFLTSTGTWANGAAGRTTDVDGVTNTGLGDVDLWVGGLAEKQMPFGGLLGSTFNFVFETQMENLQDGDRFYYLERTQGMNFLTELENNSFAKLMMANTDVTHLPGDVFTTPAFTLEVDATVQFTGLGEFGRDDPTEGDLIGLGPLVLRSDPNNPGNPLYLEYNGVDHVVLGGTLGNDTIKSSIGDDTLYGDDGNDTLEGGDGVDIVFGGAGDDMITDLGGDDLIQGQDGNDAIHGGNGINLILGGFGNDFIVTGEDASESFGGFGDDYLLGVRANEFVFGNEGDDWIEVGMVDGAAGDNFDAFGRDNVRGNDVFIGEGLTDRMDGEGGDDIMVGNGGDSDRYEGLSGFDWAVFKDAPTGATVDLTLSALDATPVLPSAQSILARFVSTEGLSGSAHADFLRGDHNTAVEIAVSGAYGSVLENIALIDGLQVLLDGLIDDVVDDGATPGTVTSFGAGNIILGGAGSDLIEGRGGDDLIDGDAWLNVRIEAMNTIDPLTGALYTGDSMKDLQAAVFAGDLAAADLHIVREILYADGPDFDTALFSGGIGNYDVVFNPDNNTWVVTDLTLIDGTDTLRNIERLQFTDQALFLDGSNADPAGFLSITDGSPTEDQLLTVSIEGVTDADNISETNPFGAITGPVSYFWQQEVSPGVWEDILFINEAPETVRATGLTFTPGDEQVGLALRVRAVYKDALDVLETVYLDTDGDPDNGAQPTAPVANLNDDPVGALLVNDPTPTEDQALVAIPQFADADGLTTAVFLYQWQQANVAGVGGGAFGGFTDIAGATAQTFTPSQAQVDFELSVVVTYTDDQGTEETVYLDTDGAQDGAQPTAPVANLNDDPVGALLVDDPTPTEDQALVAIPQFADADGLTTAVFLYQWQQANVAGVGGGAFGFTDIAGATVETFTPSQAQVDFELSVVVTYTDDQGTEETVTSAATTVTGDFIALNQPVGQTATNGVDNLTGTEGQDNISGAGGADTITALGGDDTIIYNIGDGADTVDGGAGLDTLNILGAAANQTLDVGYNGTSITNFQGGTVTGVESVTADLDDGVDTLNYNGTTAGVTVNLTTGTASGFTSIAGIENVTGGSGIDTLTGDGLVNNLNGGAGNDTINYAFGNGADTVDGGANSDTLNIIGTAAANTLDVIFNGTALTNFEGGTITGVESVTADLLGGVDRLTYSGTTAGVTVNLTTGTASGFTSIAGIENVTGGSGIDTLTGNGLGNNLSGGAGNDTLDGGLGNDILTGGANNDAVNGGAGSDTINYAFGNGADTVDGGANPDTLNIIGTGAADTLDVIFNGTALTNFEGGTITGVESVTADLLGGVDRLNYNGTTAGVTVNLTAGTASGFFSISGIENVTGGSGIDTLTGDGLANNLSGGAGNDTLNGDDGDDILTGGANNDTVNGGAGSDTINYAFGNGADTVDGGANSDTLNIIGTGAADTLDVIFNGTALTNFEGGTITGVESVTADLLGGVDRLNYNGTTAGVTVNLTTGTASGFTSIAGIENVTGGSGIDTLTGNGLGNNLSGGAGNDTLNGDDGDDILTGGANNDAVNGGAGSDTINYAFGNGADTVDGGANSDTLNIIGTGAADTLDVIFNGTALTNFEGGTITGVESVTADLVGGGVDRLNYNGTTAGVTVNLTAGTASGFTSIAGIENVTGGSGIDTLTGDGLLNILNGGAGNDTLDGGLGNDTLVGGAGTDTLTGGLGSDDIFVFSTAADAGNGVTRDVITDIEGAGVAGGDVIDLASIDANTGVVDNQAFAFIGTAAFSGAGQLRYVLDGGNTIIEGNVNANLGVDFQILLQGVHAPLGADFLL